MKKGKIIQAIVFSMILMVMLSVIPYDCICADTTRFGGIVSRATLIIRNESTWNMFANAVASGYSFTNEIVVLDENFAFSNCTMVGKKTGKAATTVAFNGTFEGNGHILSGVTIPATTGSYEGLFGNLGPNGVIRNLGVDSASVDGTNAGGIVGYNSGTIENCFFYGSVRGTNPGGIVGSNQGGQIKNCYAPQVSRIAKNLSESSTCYIGSSLDKAETIKKLNEYVASRTDLLSWNLASNTNLEAGNFVLSETAYVAPTPAPTEPSTPTDPTTPTDPSTPTTPSAQPMETTIDYDTETLEVTGPTEVYFAYTKKSADSQKIAQKEWRKAYSSDGTFCIDISKIDSKKVGYVALTTDATVAKGKIAAQRIIAVNPTYKKVEIELDYTNESTEAKGVDFLESVTVTEPGKKGKIELDLSAASFGFRWKKGTTGGWMEMNQLTLAQIESVRQTGAVLYFQLTPTDTMRSSKMVAVKVARQAAAPEITSNVKNTSLSIKNGMQFRVGNDGKWVTLNYYHKSGSDIVGVKYGSEYVACDTKKSANCTSVRFTNLSLEKLKKYLKQAGVSDAVLNSAQGFKLQVRMAPTLTKPASSITSVDVKAQAAAPGVSGVTITTDEKLKKYVIEGLDSSISYEYLVVHADVTSAEAIDAAASRWSKLSQSSGKATLSASAKSNYVTIDGNKVIGAKLGESGARLMLRVMGCDGSKGKTLAWASKQTDSIAVTVVVEEPAEEEKR